MSNPNDVIDVGPGWSHGPFRAVVLSVSANGQPYVAAIDGSSILPKFLYEQSVKLVDDAQITEPQFREYCRIRDRGGIVGIPPVRS